LGNKKKALGRRYMDLRQNGVTREQALETVANEFNIKQRTAYQYLTALGYWDKKRLDKKVGKTGENSSGDLVGKFQVPQVPPERDSRLQGLLGDLRNVLGADQDAPEDAVYAIDESEVPTKKSLETVACYTKDYRVLLLREDGLYISYGGLKLLADKAVISDEGYLLDEVVVCKDVYGKLCIGIVVGGKEQNFSIKVDGGQGYIAAPLLVEFLIDYGLELGVYKLKVINNGLLGEPIGAKKRSTHNTIGKLL